MFFFLSKMKRYRKLVAVLFRVYPDGEGNNVKTEAVCIILVHFVLKSLSNRYNK